MRETPPSVRALLDDLEAGLSTLPIMEQQEHLRRGAELLRERQAMLARKNVPTKTRGPFGIDARFWWWWSGVISAAFLFEGFRRLVRWGAGL